MKLISPVSTPVGAFPTVAAGARMTRGFKADLLALFAVLGAVLATSASLGIATFAGWQRGGLPVERAMNVILCGAAVMYVHLLPIAWRLLRVPVRMAAFALWWVGVAVVLYGQVTFLLLSQQHAGSERGASIKVTTVLPRPTVPRRTRTEIAQDVAKVEADLALADARRCEGDCPTLTVRRRTVAARLSALNIEFDEATRREAEDDRRIADSYRNEALRASLRADPVASVVASWVHTTESRLELILAVACAVVLEGAAITGWQLVSVAVGRASGGELAVAGRAADMSEPDMVAPQSGFVTIDGETDEPVTTSVAIDQRVMPTESDARQSLSGDDLLLEKIHDAVLAGEANATQASIRRLLRCGQPKAGHLNRLYLARFGAAGWQGAKHAIQ